MRVIVTRPAAQAAEWVLVLAAAGIDAVPLPLIGIEPVADAGPLRSAWATLDRFRLVVFVSPNAVARFFEAQPAGATWPTATLAGSPGPGTTRILRAAGVPGHSIAEPAADASAFDSETLWTELRRHDWVGAAVLVVRGASGRDWLAGVLAAAGARIETLCAYRRTAPALDVDGSQILRAAVAAPSAHLWFFSSSEAIERLGELPALPSGTDWTAARALATHPRIAATARAFGFGQVLESRPTPTAVVACIQSFGP